MNGDAEMASAHLAIPGSTAPAWPRALKTFALALAVVLALYWPTVDSLVGIWWRSDTFAHGFLIAPISLWLTWLRRRELARLVPQPDALGLFALAIACAAWLVAAAGQVQVVQQYAFVAMIPALVIAVLGRHVARALAFPLGFLFLAVPVGEALIPPLMNWTADFTVGALRLTGIPVYREGTFFTIPSGNWSVVEGCSGLRYLIASITVGVLYAYLTYTRLSKRVLFVALSIAVPILANGLRAYMIVMIAHLSDMKLALGVDHLIYGWLFFGLVMLLLFWIGSFWRDPAPKEDAVAGITYERAAHRVMPMGLAGTALLAVVIAAASPIWAARIDSINVANAVPMLRAPAGRGGWVAEPAMVTNWKPEYEGAASTVWQTYRSGERVVVLHLGYYRNQRRGAELLTSTNLMVRQKHPVWENVGEQARSETTGSTQVSMRETRLRSPSQRLLVWDWFRISGTDTSNRYVGKLLLARDRLLGRGDDAVEIMVATPYQLPEAEQAEATLRQFMRDMLPAVQVAIAKAAGQAIAASNMGTDQ